MRVLVDHLGFSLRGEKRIIIEEEPGEPASGTLLVYALGDEKPRLAVRASGTLTVGGWKNRAFRVADVSALAAPGEYRCAYETETGTVPGPSFLVSADPHRERLLTDILFYIRGQRCGGLFDAADRSLPVHGKPGRRVDARGGWYDASGDVSKYLSHLGYAKYFSPQQTPLAVWALAVSADVLGSVDEDGGGAYRDRFLEECAHGADFLVRMLDPETSLFYTTVFDQWSHDPAKRTICAYRTQQGILEESSSSGWREGGGMAIAALARAAASGASGELSGRDYRRAALDAFRALEARGGRPYGDAANMLDDYCRLLAASELFALTGGREFAEAADGAAASLCARFGADAAPAPHWRVEGDRPFFHASDAGLPVAALARYLETAGSREGAPAGLAETAASTSTAAMRSELALRDRVVNPFGLARQVVRASDGSAPRESFFMPHANETGYWWQGENARLASLAFAARLAARLSPPDLAAGLEAYAMDQVHWILGRNPFDLCMVHGAGRNAPVYSAYGPNAPGGVANGITSGFEDEDDIAYLPAPQAGDPSQRWRWSEQWMPHAAWLLLAVVAGIG